jgi:MIP family channel proteins
MKDPLRHFTAEFIGTFALVFVGGASILTAASTGGGLVQVALAHGLILGIMITATMRVSGHLNPAVTCGFLVTRRIEPIMGGLFIAGQVLGAIVAAYALKGLFSTAAWEAVQGTRQVIATDVSWGQAFTLEAIATFFLVFVVFGTAVDREAPKVGGFAIGLTLTAGILAIGPLTGGSMNPARSFGPAVASQIYEAQAIHWLGPIVGGIVAALVYDRIFLPGEPEPADHGAARPA